MTQPDIKALLRLARIDISPEEETALAADSEKILEFVEQIQKAHGEAGSAEPLGHSPTGEPTLGIPFNVFRDDVNPHESGIYTEAILAQAPEREGDYVKVKKIL
ncbi:MAG TPA: Asp-tRNA(Asn)/Glu-tRNA(Gln) amidotransferase subunit GatC [Candidatus Paceibacterota bacterium]|nr:Asp-tRNA(Asn)/Glu-tRNA(Gln) amidotransferase subunit GatC [Candidatus Paceibacterota bacterium]